MMLQVCTAARVEVYPQCFEPGGWSLDPQFMDVMGSPYLLAHGLGVRVMDATARVDVPESGEWRVWVRTRKWVDGAGAFRVSIGGRTLPTVSPWFRRGFKRGEKMGRRNSPLRPQARHKSRLTFVMMGGARVSN